MDQKSKRAIKQLLKFSTKNLSRFSRQYDSLHFGYGLSGQYYILQVLKNMGHTEGLHRFPFLKIEKLLLSKIEKSFDFGPLYLSDLGILYALCQNKKLQPPLKQFLKKKLSEKKPFLNLLKSENLDWLTGISGTIAALYLFIEIYPELKPVLLKKIELLALKIVQKLGKKQKNLFQNTGFAHGCSGIIVSLLKTYELTGKKKYLLLAKRLALWENKYFDLEAKNWLDLRSDRNSDQKFAFAWCNGAPGILIARIMLSQKLSGKTFHQDALNANLLVIEILERVNQATTQPNLGLCHGYFGLVEILAFSEQSKVANPTSQQVAMETFFLQYKLDASSFKKTSPDLMIGLGGVIYHALRQLYPNKIPSILW